MALDSSATFAARVRDLGLGSVLERFTELGWTTLGALAFSAGTPGAPSSEAAFDERVVMPLVGNTGGPQAALIRRLYFESTTLAAADMRRRVDRVDDDSVPQLPTEEREARRSRLQARLVGIDIAGDLDPSPSLVHVVHTMSVSGVVKYVPWETCTKFAQEAYLQPKRKQGWSPDASGVVREHFSTELPTVSVQTTHLLSQALIRRGLAMEIGMVMSFEIHEKIRHTLINALCEDPPRDTLRPVWLSLSGQTCICSLSSGSIRGRVFVGPSAQAFRSTHLSIRSSTHRGSTCSSCPWLGPRGRPGQRPAPREKSLRQRGPSPTNRRLQSRT